MNEILTYTFAVFYGILLGGVFYGGLWMTVQSIARSRHPVVLSVFSLAARIVLVGAGMYYLARNGTWVHVLAAIGGFTVVRLFMVHRLKPRIEKAGEVPE